MSYQAETAIAEQIPIEVKKKLTLDDVLRVRMEKEPGIADLLEEARADLNVAIEIALAREKRGMTQRELAESANMRTSALGRLEQGNLSPTVKTLRKLLNSLNARFILDRSGKASVELL